MWNFYASRGRNAIGESPTISLGNFTRDEPGGERDSGIILIFEPEIILLFPWEID
jgi:hypothetical protein